MAMQNLAFLHPYTQNLETDTTEFKNQCYELVCQLQIEKELNVQNKKNFDALIDLTTMLISYYRERAEIAEDIIIKRGKKRDRKKYIYSPIKQTTK
ncbi:MAG: hypothetical protein EBX41_09425 [Chitinophagia bacterium]|nr:hypothetical protein [Chitinophagia bacterium]